MQIKKIIKLYLKALEDSSYNDIIKLFTKDAVVYSPLYGKIKASKFYKELFKVTLSSKITLLNILKNENVGAGHFRYDWVLKDGTPTFFECVDIFYFSKGKIKILKIIYDTYKVRNKFEKNR